MCAYIHLENEFGTNSSTQLSQCLKLSMHYPPIPSSRIKKESLLILYVIKGWYLIHYIMQILNYFQG